MREFGLLLSILSMLIGALLILAPNVLVQLGKQTNKLYNIDGFVYRNRYLFGALLAIAGVFLIYSTV